MFMTYITRVKCKPFINIDMDEKTDPNYKKSLSILTIYSSSCRRMDVTQIFLFVLNRINGLNKFVVIIKRNEKKSQI